MSNSVTVSGNGVVDTSKRKAALKWLSENADTSELEKLVRLAKDPDMRAILKNL